MIFGGQYPLSITDYGIGGTQAKSFDELLGVGVFIDLTKEVLKPYECVYRRNDWTGLRFHFPVTDDFPPDCAATFAALVDLAKASADAGKIVYVHCRGGIGRTGTFASLFLMRHAGMTPGKAFNALARLREPDPTSLNRPAPEFRQSEWLMSLPRKFRRPG